MSTPSEIDDLQRRREKVLADLAAIGDLRPGSLTERYRKCGKPNCHCATEPNGGHGPSFSLSRQVKGKTVTRIIPPVAVAETRDQIAEYQRFRALTGEFIEISERLCDARLRVKKTSSDTAAAEKGAPENAHDRS